MSSSRAPSHGPSIRSPTPSHPGSAAPYEPGVSLEAVERELGIRDAVKLASNENVLGPGQKALEAMRRAVSRSNLYPDDSCFHLKEALAERLAVSSKEIVIGAGVTELIVLLVRAFFRGGASAGERRENAVISDGSFIMYRLALESHGVPIVSAPLRDRSIDTAAMLEAVGPSTRLLFVPNPNNPTGAWIDERSMKLFLSRLPSHVIPVIDEAYVEYASRPDFADGLGLRDHHPSLVVLRSFSKIHGLAGLRCGYAVVPERLADALRKVRQPFNVGALAQVAARAALDDSEHVERSRLFNQESLRHLTTELPKLGVETTPSAANFVLADLPFDGRLVCRAMLHEGVILRPVSEYGFPNSLRITAGTPEQNDLLLRSLQRVLSRLDEEGLSAS